MLKGIFSFSRFVARALMNVAIFALLAALMTAAMLRSTPGYFSDERELDARYGLAVRQQLAAEQTEGLFHACGLLAYHWTHLDFGHSRTWDAPVSELVRDHSTTSAKLLSISLPLSWILTVILALPFGAKSSGSYEFSTTVLISVMLALPAGALATICIVADYGGPTLVLTSLLIGRQFRFLRTAMQQAWSTHHVHVARSFGCPSERLFRKYIVPQILPLALPLCSMSVITALAALVPVEVLFDQAGLGKLAWQASSNRDMPVLAAVTLVFAAGVAVAAALSNQNGNGSRDERQGSFA